MKTNSELRALALESLKGRWKPAIIATLALVVVEIVATVISGGENAGVIRVLLGLAVNFLVYLPISIAAYNAFKAYTLRESDDVLAPMVDDCKANYTRYLLGMLLMMVIVMVGTILLIIPGIIAALGLSMLPYILKENPELGIVDACKKSWEMTNGYKVQILLLGLSFIGWGILCIFTLCIGFLWLAPYMYCSYGQFYEALKANA